MKQGFFQYFKEMLFRNLLKSCVILCLIFYRKIHKFTDFFFVLDVRGLPSQRTLDFISTLVITTTQLHSKKLELGFRAGSNHACGVSEICDAEKL